MTGGSQEAEKTDQLCSAATSIFDSSAALIDPSLAPPCSLQQSSSTQGTRHILAVCVSIHVFLLMHNSAEKKERHVNTLEVP